MRVIKNIFLAIVGLIVILIALVITSFRPNFPSNTVELIPTTSAEGMNVLVFGGTRNTGLELTKLLTARGDRVTAFVRPTSDRSQLQKLDVKFAVGDAMKLDTIVDAFSENNFDAVVSTIGNIRGNPPPDFQGNANIFDAAVKSGVKRVVMISTIGAGNSSASWLSKIILSDVLPLKTQAEEYLRETGLDFTIIRPGGLPPDEGTGGGVLTEDPETFGFIARADLARLIVGVLDDNKTIGKTYSAIDLARSSPWDRDN
ncbi:MAG: SDR family oxidoreductase [Pseudomonadota bacterium]|nr:SDR family oxidoreductase [Pseudomonadota bacterium]